MPTIDFIETRRNLDIYCRGRNCPFLIEALSRLDQLTWLVSQIELVEPQALAAHQVKVQFDYENSLDPAVVGFQTLVEAFYYLAWRLISLLDRTDSPIPN